MPGRRPNALPLSRLRPMGGVAHWLEGCQERIGRCSGAVPRD